MDISKNQWRSTGGMKDSTSVHARTFNCMVFISCFLDNIFLMEPDNNVSQNATKIYTSPVMWIHPKSKES